MYAGTGSKVCDVASAAVLVGLVLAVHVTIVVHVDVEGVVAVI